METPSFYFLIKDIVKSDNFKEMKKYKHHKNTNLFRHSIKVAYLCYKHHIKHKMKIDIKEFVQGALLHDYYLYNLHGDQIKHKLHLYKHPRVALNNAIKNFPDLTATQQDMILRHMFPITPLPPKTIAGFLVCFYDKVASIDDRFKRVKKK